MLPLSDDDDEGVMGDAVMVPLYEIRCAIGALVAPPCDDCPPLIPLSEDTGIVTSAWIVAVNIKQRKKYINEFEKKKYIL